MRRSMTTNQIGSMIGTPSRRRLARIPVCEAPIADHASSGERRTLGLGLDCSEAGIWASCIGRGAGAPGGLPYRPHGSALADCCNNRIFLIIFNKSGQGL